MDFGDIEILNRQSLDARKSLGYGMLEISNHIKACAVERECSSTAVDRCYYFQVEGKLRCPGAWPRRKPQKGDEMAVVEQDPEAAVMLLRIELYSAMQRLKGENLESFWKLIREIAMSDPETE